MNDGQIRDAVLRILAEVVPGAKLDGLDPAVPFRDQIEFDSVDYVNFIFAVEKAFTLQVDEIDCPRLSSLAGCLAYLGEITTPPMT